MSFIRLGAPPEGGFSCDTRTGCTLPGVSVFQADPGPDGSHRLALDSLFLRVAFTYFYLAQRRAAYEVRGRLVGYGPDGDPLLRDVSIIQEIPRSRIKPLPFEGHLWRDLLAVQNKVPEEHLRWQERAKLLPREAIEDEWRALWLEQPISESQAGENEKDPFEELLDSVLPHATATARDSALHGPDHWRRVAKNGEELLKTTPGADGHVVRLFSALHDAMRLSDGHDLEHGRRAAVLAERLRAESVFEATDEQLRLLTKACEEHTLGETTADPTVGCCFDADRLDLPRCGITPDPSLLSTEAARKLLGAHSRHQQRAL